MNDRLRQYKVQPSARAAARGRFDGSIDGVRSYTPDTLPRVHPLAMRFDRGGPGSLGSGAGAMNPRYFPALEPRADLGLPFPLQCPRYA